LNSGTELPEQEYENVTIVNNTEQLPTPAFFNNEIEKHPNSIIVCLDEYNALYDGKGVQKIVDFFVKNNDIPCIIYTDTKMRIGGAGLVNHLPAFSQGGVMAGFGINQPIVFETFTHTIPSRPFNEQLDSMYFYDMFVKCARSYILHHIPETVFVSTSRQPSQQDISVLNEQSG